MSQRIKILYLGDIFAEGGRRMVMQHVPKLRHEHKLDLVLANSENAANGRGMSQEF